MKCIYYPGCSQKASSISYEKSFLAVAKALGIEIIELEDWNCCGTTVAISLNKNLSLTLAARNLALAEPHNLPVVAPCPSCYISLNKVNKLFKENDSITKEVNESLNEGNLNYKGKVKVYNILDFLVNEVGIDKIKEKVIHPFTGIKIAPYYGCQMVNPYATGDNNDNPQNIEKIIEALGAIPIDHPSKTVCCGGSMMFTKKEHSEKMSNEILKSIADAKADMITTPCGLCQVNLDFAKKVSQHNSGENISMPVLSITQLIGIALGVNPSDLMVNVKKITELSHSEVITNI